MLNFTSELFIEISFRYMEVGNFNQRGNSRGRGRGGYRGEGRGNQSNHNSTGQQNHQKKKDVNEIGKDQCRKCLGFGHWAPDCLSENQ